MQENKKLTKVNAFSKVCKDTHMVFINETFSSFRRELLYYTQKFRKNNGQKLSRTRDGNVWLRENESSKGIVVHRFQYNENLFGRKEGINVIPAKNEKTLLVLKYYCLMYKNIQIYWCMLIIEFLFVQFGAGTSLGTLLQIYSNVYLFCKKTFLFRFFSVKKLCFLSFSMHLYLILSC